MLPEVYPKIDIFWAFEKNRQKEYREAFSRLVTGQINAVGEATVGVVVIEGMWRAIPIVLDDGRAFEQIPSRLSACVLITDAYYPVIYLEKVYYNEMCKNHVAWANIYHEVGHFYMKHMTRKPDNMLRISESRREAKRNHEVFWQERDADEFACHYVGNENMIAHLKNMRRIIQLIAKDDPGFASRIDEQLEEADMRIKLVEERNKS